MQANPEQRLSSVGIGASEIATVAGLNPFESPWALWRRKTGRASEKTETPPMRWGKLLEPAIRAEYVERHGCSVLVPQESLFHPENAWARATPDGIVLSDPHDIRSWSHLVQIKNVGAWVHKSWQDEPPAYVVLQEQWELYVSRLKRADIAALIGGSDYREYTVWRDEKMIADLVDIARAFWRCIVDDREPEIDGSEECARELERRAVKSGVLVPRDSHVDSVVEIFKLQRDEERHLKKDIEFTKNRLRKLMADAKADGIETEDGPVIWSTSAGAKSTNWEAIARELGADDIAIARHTTTKDPVRSIRAPKAWDKESK